MMRKLFVIAAFLLASTAAQAQYTFEYGGRTIRIDPDRGTVSIPGVYDNTGRKSKRSRNDDSDRARKPAPDQVKTDPQPPAAPPASTEQTPALANPQSEPATATATVAPTTDTITSVPSPANTPLPPFQQDAVPSARPAPPPAVATAQSNTPLGLWLTEEKEGKVRIEQCGTNLCGYSVDEKSNQNGEQVLVNMKAGKDAKWSGRIFDPKSGSTYDSTIAMKGTGTLRVQGCAFGGMFCGGQTWSRLN
jgi:uncharacterized protein (DUF2147 family)